jgi:hypothetical protein
VLCCYAIHSFIVYFYTLIEICALLYCSSSLSFLTEPNFILSNFDLISAVTLHLSHHILHILPILQFYSLIDNDDDSKTILMRENQSLKEKIKSFEKSEKENSSRIKSLGSVEILDAESDEVIN